MSWPSIKNPNSINVSHIRELIKTNYDTGAVESRPKFTKSRKTFELGWKDKGAMSLADLNLLLAAFDTDLGSSFTWENPDTQQSYTVIYSKGQVGYVPIEVGSGWYTVTVSLEEP